MHKITVKNMRMIGIGLMGFLLAGIALLLSTMNILEQGKRFDMIVVEERLRLFRQSAMSGKVDTAVAAKHSGGSLVSSGAALLDRFPGLNVPGALF